MMMMMVMKWVEKKLSNFSSSICPVGRHGESHKTLALRKQNALSRAAHPSWPYLYSSSWWWSCPVCVPLYHCILLLRSPRFLRLSPAIYIAIGLGLATKYPTTGAYWGHLQPKIWDKIVHLYPFETVRKRSKLTLPSGNQTRQWICVSSIYGCVFPFKTLVILGHFRAGRV